MWSEEAIALTTREWKAGFSAGQISIILRRDLGIRKTRNAVIGKLHRLGVAGRGRPSPTPRPSACKARRNRTYHAPKCAPLKPEAPAPVEPLNTPLLEVSDLQCKAVVDQTEWGRAKCCGHPAEAGRSYCTHHEAMFYTLQARTRAM